MLTAAAELPAPEAPVYTPVGAEDFGVCLFSCIPLDITVANLNWITQNH